MLRAFTVGDYMSKKRGHGKISKLPEVLRREVDAKLLDGHTYEQIAEYLKGMGQDIHARSVGRYGKPFLERFEAVRVAKLYAKALAEDNIDRPTTELHEANNAMVSQILMDTLISGDIEPIEKIRAANSIAQLQSAQVRNEKLKIDSRKARNEIKIAFDIFKNQVFAELSANYPEVCEIMVKIANKVVEEVTTPQ